MPFYGIVLTILIFVQYCQFVDATYKGASFIKANFEDTRCRCICPSTDFFRSHNNTQNNNYRRYYTKSNVNVLTCNTQIVVKQTVSKIVDKNRLDAFLANCNCKFESRNSLLLKNVVLFVICLIFALGSYMTYLIVFDPMLRRPTLFIPYCRQEDDLEDNIFVQSPINGRAVSSNDALRDGIQIRTRVTPTHNVLKKVEAEQSKWMNDVEEQRRKVMMEHSMLN